jgi:phage head maturation protease
MAKRPTQGAFIAEALVVDTNPTAYLTKFKDNALVQIASKVNNDGVPLLLSHDSSKLPSGAWFEANVQDKTVMSKFYIPKEVSEYQDVKSRIESNILDSVSVGFNAKVHECSICHNSIYDYEACAHFPGKEYEIKDDTGTTLGTETCYVLLDDVKLSEISLVYSGAVPEAKIVDYDDKKEFFEKNHLQFDKGELEVVQTACTYHICNENNNNEGETQMDEKEFQELQQKYMDLRESLVTTKEQALEFKEKAEKYDEALTVAEEAKTKFNDLLSTYKETVEKLAAPFDVDYKAPDDLEAITADLQKFIDQAKALPTNQQSSTEQDEVKFEEPDDVYKI